MEFGTSGNTSGVRLISHRLCPYVQRAAIALLEKGVPFERVDIDLAAKPAWFLAVSPLGKVPVLVDRGQAVFESAVIVEYLEETQPSPLHPATPLERARHRGWVELASATLAEIAAFYAAPDEARFVASTARLHARFAFVETQLGHGPWFAGGRFSLVDAAWAPVFRYLDSFDRIEAAAGLARGAKVTAWRRSLAARASVRAAVTAEYPALLDGFLRGRGSCLAGRMAPSRD